MSEFERLLELSDLDTHIDQLRHRRANDPLHAALTDADAALVAVDAEAQDVAAARHEIAKEQNRFEDEVALLEDKVAKFEGQLYDGTVTAHKELESIQAEIAHLKERKSTVEDSVMEQMEAAEPLDASLEELAARRRSIEEEREATAQRLTVLTAEIDADLDATATRRNELVASLDGALVETYETLRTNLIPAATRLGAGGRCEGCHLTLPRVDYDTLKRAPADETLFCPECGRILVR